MFIHFGNRRINLSLVRQYTPVETRSTGKTYYNIELLFLNGDKELLHFFDKEQERNEFLEKLDQNKIE
jgi:hypothetical protein